MVLSFQVTFDCADPHALADWWAEALEWSVEPSDEGFIRDMISRGFATNEDTTTHNGALVWKSGATIRHPDPGAGPGARMLFQLVPEAKTVKNRVHLDIRSGPGNATTVVERLTSTGATVLHQGQQGPHTWVTMADPEGNEFCIS